MSASPWYRQEGRQRLTGALAAACRRWALAERGRFVLFLPPLMAAGAALFLSLRIEPPAWLAAALPGAGAVLLAALWRWTLPRAAAGAALALALGFASAGLATWRAPPPMAVPTRATQVSGEVAAVEPLPQGRRVTLAGASFEGGPAQARLVRIRLRDTDDQPIETGDTLSVRALLMRPARPAWPGAWDGEREAFYRGFGAYGTALGVAGVTPGTVPGIAGALRRLREGIAARVTAALPGAVGAIAATLLTGETGAIPDADRRAFRDAGLAHLLAIAGLHVGIVMGLVFGAVRFGLALWEWAALAWPVKEIAALASLFAAASYMLLTGAHLPVQRSFAMAALFTLGVLAGRRAISLRGLGLAMAALVLAEPAEVVGPSFQMSFSAVLALIVGYAKLQPALWRLRGEGGLARRVLGTLAALALTAALAGTASAPFAAYHFGQIQLYNVLANTLAVPLAAFLVMPAGIVALALMPFGLEAVALAPMGWGIHAILWVAHTAAAAPEATILVAHMPPWGLALLAGSVAWAGLWRTRLRLLGWGGIAAALATPLLAPAPDILLSADGRIVGLRDATGMFVESHSTPARFTLESWQTLWRVRYAAPLACGGSPCVLRPTPGGPDALLLPGGNQSPPPDVCAHEAVISMEPLHLDCPGVTVLDRFSVWREGAIALWLTPQGTRVESDASWQGARAWTVRPTPRPRIPAGLVPALSE